MTSVLPVTIQVTPDEADTLLRALRTHRFATSRAGDTAEAERAERIGWQIEDAKKALA